MRTIESPKNEKIDETAATEATATHDDLSSAFGGWGRQEVAMQEPSLKVFSQQKHMALVGGENVEPPRDVEELVAARLVSAGRGRIKVDQTTLLEALFGGSAFLGGFLLVVACASAGGIPSVSFFSVLGGLLLFTGIIGYRVSDNYYIVDLNRHQLIYHFQFLHIVQETVMFDLKAAACVTSHSCLRHYKDKSWFDYATALVMKDGTVFPLTDYEKDGLLQANVRARLLAGCLGIPFVAGCENTETEVRFDQNNGEVRIFHRPVAAVELSPQGVVAVAGLMKKTAKVAFATLPAVLVGLMSIIFLAPFLILVFILLGALLLHLFFLL